MFDKETVKKLNLQLEFLRKAQSNLYEKLAPIDLANSVAEKNKIIRQTIRDQAEDFLKALGDLMGLLAKPISNTTLNSSQKETAEQTSLSVEQFNLQFTEKMTAVKEKWQIYTTTIENSHYWQDEDFRRNFEIFVTIVISLVLVFSIAAIVSGLLAPTSFLLAGLSFVAIMAVGSLISILEANKSDQFIEQPVHGSFWYMKGAVEATLDVIQSKKEAVYCSSEEGEQVIVSQERINN